MVALFLSLMALVTFNSVVSDRSERLYLMDVKLPTLEERQESAELYNIEDFLSRGNKDRHVFKVQGEPRAFAVLEMNRECQWEYLTTNFVHMGEDFFTTALYDGRYFAEDLGVNSSVIKKFSKLQNSNLYFIEVTFHFVEKSPHYAYTLGNLTERLLSEWPSDSPMAFYKVLGEVPARVLFFANLKPAQVEELHFKFGCPSMCGMKITAIQQFRNYMAC